MAAQSSADQPLLPVFYYLQSCWNSAAAELQVIKEDVDEQSMALQEHCPDPSAIMDVSHQIAWTSACSVCLNVP